MAHPNVERYLEMTKAGLDPEAVGDWLADDVRWYEAGNPTPWVGKDAVADRVRGITTEVEPVEMQADTVLADDDNLVVVGSARFTRGEDSVSYRFVEHYALVDGKVVERRSYMDATPEDVARFFGS
jgi:ketosteroid isomerase-like protein